MDEHPRVVWTETLAWSEFVIGPFACQRKIVCDEASQCVRIDLRHKGCVGLGSARRGIGLFTGLAGLRQYRRDCQRDNPRSGHIDRGAAPSRQSWRPGRR